MAADAEDRKLVFDFGDLEDELTKAMEQAKETRQRVKNKIEHALQEKESE